VCRRKLKHTGATLGVDVGEDEKLHARRLGALKGLGAVGVELLGIYV
jgi:hypothetical protein